MKYLKWTSVSAVCMAVLLSCGSISLDTPDVVNLDENPEQFQNSPNDTTTAGTEEQPGCESGNGFDACENDWKDTVNLEL